MMTRAITHRGPQQPFALVACLALATFALHAAEPTTLRLLKTVPLPEVSGRFDHFAADAKGRRIFMAALGNDSLEVIDAAAGKHLQSIPGLHKPAGLVYLAETNLIGVASGGDDSFKLFDGTSYRPVHSLPDLEDADNVRREPSTRLIFIGYGEGALALLDESGRRRVRRIELSGHPESFQLETKGTRIFVNVPEKREITVVDRNAGRATGHWPLKSFGANFPMALDEVRQRLFVGCRKPARLLVLDTADGRPVADVPIGGDTDDLFYDAQRKRLYVSCGEGMIDVIEQQDADHYVARERIPTRPGARTSYFSAELDAYCVAVPRQGNHAAELRIYEPHD